MTEQLREELYNYCAIMIPHFQMKECIALERIDINRCPLQMADSNLYYEMYDQVSEYCEDNDIDMEEEDIDIEEIFLPC